MRSSRVVDPSGEHIEGDEVLQGQSSLLDAVGGMITHEPPLHDSFKCI